MPRVGFVTCVAWPELSPSDTVARQALERRGIEVITLPWNGPGVSFDGVDALILRSNWDYHFDPDSFLTWLGERERAGARIWNTPDLVRWNFTKRYLNELPGAGVATIPTVVLHGDGFDMVAVVMARKGWRKAVVKPLISASGHDTHLICGDDPDRAIASLRTAAIRLPAIVQPFVEEVRTRGEWSLIFADGVLTHAVLKRPAAGEFRVQPRFGGSADVATPGAAIVTAGDRVIRALPAWPLYARVDGVETERGFVLMEVELNEPGLFFHLAPHGAEAFADAVLRRL